MGGFCPAVEQKRALLIILYRLTFNPQTLSDLRKSIVSGSSRFLRSHHELNNVSENNCYVFGLGLDSDGPKSYWDFSVLKFFSKSPQSRRWLSYTPVPRRAGEALGSATELTAISRIVVPSEYEYEGTESA